MVTRSTYTLGTPTGQVGSVPGDANYVTDAEILSRVAAMRRNRGLEPDAASDHIWLDRINAGSHNLGDARTRIERKAATIVSPPEPEPEPRDAPEPDPFDFHDAARSLMPYLPRELIGAYADSWAETGDPDIALSQMRQSSGYQEFFPGNLRDDGTVRLAESAYFAEEEAFEGEVSSYGVPPRTLSHLYPELVEHGVRPDEFRRRMANMYTNIAGNVEEVRQFYRDNFGADSLSIRSLMASALDPSTNPVAMEREMRQAQIGGEAARAGFGIDMSEVERLEEFGLEQQAAREFYTQAQTLLPDVQTLLDRHHDPQDEFTLEALTDAVVIGDPDQRETIERLFAQEQSQFSPFGLFNIQQGGTVEGIRQR